jgi:predicted deacylase
MPRQDVLTFGGESIALGQRRNLALAVSQSYSGAPVVLPITVWRAGKPGPAVFVTAAVHGDEINGTGIVREIILNAPFELISGSLVLVPVVNLLGFERHTRYLPDRRDMNRCFPGSAEGSLASRMAHVIFSEVISQCDYGIDLHTAAVRRTNFPSVRADLKNTQASRIARAFGCEVIVNRKGPRASLRREACDAGCATIILEAGEVWKIEPNVVQYGVRGIRNVLIELGMVEGSREEPVYQVWTRKTIWVRASFGGMLAFHVAPGDIVEKDQPLATNTDLLGEEQNVLCSPSDGIVLGMTTLPTVTPGNPVCHIAVPRGGLGPIRRALQKESTESLHGRLRDDLATSVTVSEPAEPSA